MKIMRRRQNAPEDLARAVKVVEVATAKSCARRAGTVRVDGLIIELVARVANVEISARGEQASVSSVPGGEDAIKHIDP